MSFNTAANYHTIFLDTGKGTLGIAELGNGVTASTVHQVFCLTAGSIDVVPFLGDSFTWAATGGQYLDVVAKSLTVTSGTFVAFKAKHSQHQWGPRSKGSL